MKNIFKTTIICVSALAITSCNDWLDTKSDSQLDESALYTSVESIKLATYGVYADLCDEPYTQLMTIHQGAGTDIELIDGIGQTATGDNERGGMNYNATTSWAKLGVLWEKQYKTIEDCNRIVDGIKASSLIADPEVMKARGVCLPRLLYTLTFTVITTDSRLPFAQRSFQVLSVFRGCPETSKAYPNLRKNISRPVCNNTENHIL